MLDEALIERFAELSPAERKLLVRAAEAGEADAEAAGFPKKPESMPKALPMVAKEARKRPAPLLTRDGGAGVVLAAGEAAVLAGAGGGGKSQLALQLAIAAAGGVDRIAPFGGRREIEMAHGPAVYLAYEDDAAWMEWRARRIATWLDKNSNLTGEPYMSAAKNPDRLRLYCPDYAAALFEVSLGARPGSPEALPHESAWWPHLWQDLRKMKPRLIVVDPVALAFAVDGYGAVGVGRFIGAIRRELAALEKPCGALLVAHTSRAGRRKQRDEADAAPMGSVAWTDRPRSVLHLEPKRKDDDSETHHGGLFRLRLLKANYARRGTLATLEQMRDRQNRPVAFRLAETPEGATDEDQAPATDEYGQRFD